MVLCQSNLSDFRDKTSYTHVCWNLLWFTLINLKVVTRESYGVKTSVPFITGGLGDRHTISAGGCWKCLGTTSWLGHLAQSLPSWPGQQAWSQQTGEWGELNWVLFSLWAHLLSTIWRRERFQSNTNWLQGFQTGGNTWWPECLVD